MNATQHTVSNRNNIPSSRDKINTAENSVSIINKEVDTDLNTEVAQKVQKDHSQPPSPVYPRKEVNAKAFTLQSKAIAQKSKLVPDTHVLNSDLSDGSL